MEAVLATLSTTFNKVATKRNDDLDLSRNFEIDVQYPFLKAFIRNYLTFNLICFKSFLIELLPTSIL